MAKKKVHMDFGHGKLRSKDGAGDTGAINVKEGLIEADLNEVLGFAAAENLLNNYENVEVKFTRKDDTFVSLSHRADMANEWGADVFMSCHVNAGGGTGYESYIYNKNTSIGSINLQKSVNKFAIAAAKKYGLGTHGNAYKRESLAVVRQTHMPAILTEVGYIDNEKDIKLLKNESFLKDMGYAYGDGIAEFLGLAKKKVQTAPIPSETSSVVGKLVVVTYTGKEGLAVRKTPSFDAPIETHVHEGEAFTIAAVTGSFYKLKSGLYITNSPTYVKVK